MHRFACTGTQSPTGCVELGRVCLSNNVRSRKIEFGVRDKWPCPVEFQELHEQLLQMVFAESIDHAFRRKSSGHGLPLGYSVGKHFGWVIKSFLFSCSSAGICEWLWMKSYLPSDICFRSIYVFVPKVSVEKNSAQFIQSPVNDSRVHF